jgi:hypothetical protein
MINETIGIISNSETIPLQWNNLRIIYNKYVMHIKQKPFNNFTNKILLLFFRISHKTVD